MNLSDKIILLIIVVALCIIQIVSWYMDFELDITEIITLVIGLITGYVGKPKISKAIYYFRKKD